jgi:hypothetical protein
MTALLLTGSLLFAANAQSSRQNATRPAPAKSAKVDFVHDVQPILKASCYPCHGSEQQLGGLRLDTRAAAFRGGVSGKSILPGKAKESLLLQRILGEGGKPRMPMGFAPLDHRQTALIRRWIEEGAEWRENVTARKHWAYVKPTRPPLPEVKNAAWVRNPIDRFVLARLERAKLTPSPPADRATLIRRVYLDLIGLPPSPQEVDAFLQDRSPDAYEKVVDRLLASPHYGERWARPWLDLARYADSNGYEKDGRRSIWLYRDWVINALNRDMPYDQFTIEQLAGDMLPGATQAQRIATGFHRNTMLNEEGGVDREEQRWLTIVDRVATTGSVWMGTTLACAQCHDHKYDPFSQEEYYRFFAFFDNSDEPTLELISPEEAKRRTDLQQEAAALEQRVKANAQDREAAERLERVRKELAAIQPPTTLVMQEKPGSGPPATYYRIKGAYLSRGEKMTAATPAVLNPFPKDRPVNRLGLAYWLASRDHPLTARVAVNRAWEQFFGRGLVETTDDFGTQGRPPTHPDLLDWLAVEFMEPSVKRPGARPWSMKALHRLIVTSATYRQSSRVTPLLLERDPENRLLARGPRFRMEAEMIRDNALAASGLLSRKIGGPSVFPYQPEGVWDVPYSGDRWTLSEGEDRYRRGLYTFWRRTSPYPAFMTFDATSREFCTTRRVRTNTPLQALTLLNDPGYLEAARGLAQRMRREGGNTVQQQIAYGFRCCLARRPTHAELARLERLYQQQLRRYQADPKAAQAFLGAEAEKPENPELAAMKVVASVMLNLDEAMTKE